MTKKTQKTNQRFVRRSLGVGGLFILIAGILFSQSFGWTSADTVDDQLKARYEQAEKYRKLIEIKQKQQGTLANQLSIMESEDKKLEAEIDIKKDELGTTTDQIERLNGQIAEYEKSIHSQRIILGDIIRSYYENKRGQSVIELLAEDNFYATLQKEDGVIQTEEKMKEVVDNINALKQKLEKEGEILKGKQDELEKITEQLEDKNEKLEINKAQKKTLLETTKGEEAKYQKLLSNIENEIYRIESSKVADLSNLPAAKGGYFNYPVSVSSITQSYGCLNDSFARKSYPSCNNGRGGFHNGIDFGRNSGQNIYSARGGTVIESGNNKGFAYGQWLAIDHGDGLVTLYGHLSSKAISKGSKVKAGDKIGVMGTTGYSTGVHLHFSVFDKKSFEIVESSYIKGLYIPTGASVNPSRYF